MSQYLKIQYWNDTDLGDILYQDGFKGLIYLNVEVEKPEYNTTIESNLNGDNVEIAKYRKVEKVRRFECWMQEDLVDAFELMQIHDNIEVTLRTGEVLSVVKHSLRVEPSWEEIGCLAKVVVTFIVDYVSAGSCNQNMVTACLCDESGGDFEYIVEYSSLIGEPDGTIVLAWTVEDIADKKYTAALYQFSYAASTWLPLPVPDQYTCWQNLDDSSTWIYDGQFWHLFPGYLISLAWTGAGELTVIGYTLPGTFVSIYYRTPADPPTGPGGGAWSIVGDDHTADEFSAGVVKTGLAAQSYDVKVHVWNHSCDYGYTELMAIAAAP